MKKLANQIVLYREQAIQLDAILKKVEERGGPAMQWTVDLERHIAILGPMQLGFYLLSNGSFSPSSYNRSDCKPDIHRDGALLEDAYFCIAQAISKLNKPGKGKEIMSHATYYRNLAHSYRNSALAMLSVFGKDKNINTIKLIRGNDLTAEDQNSDKTLLLPFPFYYCLSHSLELCMKGYLLLKGKNANELKKIRHNFQKLKIECENIGFEFNINDSKCIIGFEELNINDFALRYPNTIEYSLPDYRFSIDLINRFIKQLPIASPLPQRVL